MKEKKENKTPKGKVAIKLDKIMGAYGVLNTPTDPKTGRHGFKMSTLDAKDMYIVIRAVDALRPIAERHLTFEKDARERLKPENFGELAEKFNNRDNLPEKERAEVIEAVNEYGRKVEECVITELEKEREVEAYEHLSEEAFGKIVKENTHLLTDMQRIMLLREVLA